MNNLEMQVREALVEKGVEEAYELLQQPEYMTAMKEAISDLILSQLYALCRAGAEKEAEEKGETLPEDWEMPEEDKADIHEEVLPELKAMLGEFFDNDSQLREMLYTNMRNNYHSTAQKEEQLNQLYEQLKSDEDFGDEALEEFKRANQTLLRYAEHQDRIVAGLVEIAERDGVEKAATEEAVHEVTQSIFPTAKQYIDHALAAKATALEYSDHAHRAMMMDGPAGKMIGATLLELPKMIARLEKVVGNVMEDRIYKQAAEIYGADAVPKRGE